MPQLPRAIREVDRAGGGPAQAHPPREQRPLPACDRAGGAAAVTTTTGPMPLVGPWALPPGHGGWGFLLEPLVRAMIVAPSWCGAMICAGAVCGFLTRQPLKLAMQDLL